MTRDEQLYDIAGIGIGPFNLGLAALSDPLDDLTSVFFDSADEFRWHPGMMIEGATIQVPFLADLVSMADPTSRFSFLNHLKHTSRLYPFYIRESFYPLRAEYDAYCRWVAEQLGTLRWGRTVTQVEEDAEGLFTIRAERRDGGPVEVVRARHVVVGTGTSPRIPEALRGVQGPLVHSSEYLPERDRLRRSPSVTIVGSGQSAAEIYRDLLETSDEDHRVDWITRSPRFFPMEYTKLTLELTSPEYTDHFHSLPADLRDRLGREQRSLYKGISAELVDDIYDALYRKSVGGPVSTTLLTETSVTAVDWDPASERFSLELHHEQLGTSATRHTHDVVLATGYASGPMRFLAPLGDVVRRDARGRLDVARDYSIDGGRGRLFVQNGEEHTHGLTAPDLGFGAWRNSSILASVTGREVYPLERRIAFQEFGLPDESVAALPAATLAGAAR